MYKKNLTLALCGMALAGSGNCSNALTSISTQETLKACSIKGDWSGTLDIGMMKMTLVLHILQDSHGKLSANFDTLEHKLTGTPIDWITFDKESLKFEVKALFGTFEGLLINNDSEISGQFSQGGQSFPLTFGRNIVSIAAPIRPQEPKHPYPYTEEEVSFDNSGAAITLSGTLTLPVSKGPTPAVILIAGSGPSDRDASLLGHKPFLVLGDHLTRQGIAVLRFDKRGCGKSTGNYDKATIKDFANDVRAAVAYLKSHQKVNSAQIGLVGHSEGGIIAPMLGAESKDVAFIVLMAAPGVNGEELLYEQGVLIKRSLGETEEAIEQNRKFQERLFAILKSEPDPQIASTYFREIAKNHIDAVPEVQGKMTIDSLEGMANYANTEWFRHFLLYDPNMALKQVNAPLLVLNGELDLQVSPKQNLSTISKALEEGGNKDVTVVELPKLNHLFQTCQSGSVAEYAEIEETISPLALDLISKWILEKTNPRKN